MSRTYKQQNKALQAELTLLEEALRSMAAEQSHAGVEAQSALDQLEDMRKARLLGLLRESRLLVSQPFGLPYGKAVRAAHKPSPPPGLALATGKELDFFSKRFIGMERQPGEADNAYRERLIARYAVPAFAWKDIGGDMHSLTRDEWLEQYTQTPRPTREVVIEQLLPIIKCSREFLHHQTDKQLLTLAKEHKIDSGLRFALERLIGEARQVWIRHDGGPCPVRHEEVEVKTRGSVTGPRRCWPESVNWHWGRPGVDATPIDVLHWRRVD